MFQAGGALRVLDHHQEFHDCPPYLGAFCAFIDTSNGSLPDRQCLFRTGYGDMEAQRHEAVALSGPSWLRALGRSTPSCSSSASSRARQTGVIDSAEVTDSFHVSAWEAAIDG